MSEQMSFIKTLFDRTLGSKHIIAAAMPVNSLQIVLTRVLFIPTHSTWETALWTGFPHTCLSQRTKSWTLCACLCSDPLSPSGWCLSGDKKELGNGVTCLLSLTGDQKELGKVWLNPLWTWQMFASGWTLARPVFLGKGQEGSKGDWCSLSAGGCLRGAVWARSFATGLLADLSSISSCYWEIIWLMLMTELAPSMSYCLSLPADVNKISSWYYSLLLPQLSLMRQPEWSPLFLLPCQSTPGPG